MMIAGPGWFNAATDRIMQNNAAERTRKESN